jgi:DNA-binding protein H-NS
MANNVSELLERRRRRFAEPEPPDEPTSAFSEAQRGVLGHVVAGIAEQAGDEAGKALRGAIKALRAEMQTELAVTRDEIMGRIDAKLYGSGLDVDAEELRRATFELKSDFAKHASTTSALLDEIAKRVDRVDSRRRYDRNTAHREKTETLEKIAGLLAAMTAKTDEKLNKLAAGLADLEARVAEAFAADEPGRRGR